MMFKHVYKKGQQFRMWMPNMPLTLVAAHNASATKPAFAIFRTIPRMTKHEIKEYLTKIYQLPVLKVRTQNYLGKRKRLMTKRRVIYYKYKDFKRAIVDFDPNVMTDVGIGLRVPELQEDDDDDYVDDDDDEEEENAN
ncbi:hypothetical protein ACA910_017752 [Epithemia clementina (nom. ined.)]